MYRKFYWDYILYALIGCSLLVGYAYIDREPFNWVAVIFAFIFGILLMTFIMIRLPLFNQYYIHRAQLKHKILKMKAHDHGTHRVAPVMASLISAMIFGIILYVLGFESFKVECFVAAIATGVMSFYYAPD
ncbi:hypothetical protein QSV37_09885 [Acinetobacter sp. VNK23]|uniref:hypothetical protein n=1 Tax=Acinetobacter thutiue TaxID=2998078 RepID=UPI0025763164|nr:hypothetical protein [Acinetobacter thutiue]MDM1020603.1 hypothetical protein [Acinetobacter thutiue]